LPGCSRDFLLTEKFKLEFRAEAFNIANHPQYAQPNLNLQDTNPQTNFGTISNTLLESERRNPVRR
jgi:hypothetical protein